MRLCDLGVLTDENIHPDVVAFWRAEGMSVRTAVELGLTGCEDVEVLRRAHAEGRLVVTHDADFGRLAVAAGTPLVGIVYLRPGHILPAFTIAAVRSLLNANPEVHPPFMVVVRRTGGRVALRMRSLGV